MKYRSVRGTHDIIGSEVYKFDKIIIEISKLGQIFNFQKIETPIFDLKFILLNKNHPGIIYLPQWHL